MARIIVVGAGGVGAETLKLLSQTSHAVRVIDRDFVDADTLQRQTLYRKSDLGKLKAEAAATKLSLHDWKSEHLSENNADSLLKGANVVLDCTDNWATRAVLNAWALRKKTPWIFTSAIRSETMTTTLTPKTPCFVCWNRAAKTPRSCRVEGIRKETTAAAAQTQVAELEALSAGRPWLAGILQYTDTESKTCTNTPLAKDRACPACVRKTFRLPKATAQILCGDGEYLFNLKSAVKPGALKSLRPKKFGDVLKIEWKGGELIVFRNGRVLARGFDEKDARAAFDVLRQKQAA